MTVGEDSLYFQLTCDLDVPVYVQVGRLKGLERNTQSHTEAIYVVAQLSQGGEAISLPVPTPPCCTSADSHAWDVWLSFPVKYRDLQADATLCLTVWRKEAGHGPIVVGGASLPLFSKRGRLKTGRQSARLWKGYEASCASPSATPAKVPVSQRSELERLELLVRRYERGEMTHLPWLDRITLSHIAKLRASATPSDWQVLEVTLPSFEICVLHYSQSAGNPVPPAAPKKSTEEEEEEEEIAPAPAPAPAPPPAADPASDVVLRPIIDPEVGRECPPEQKAQKLARGGARGLEDRNLKPDTDQREAIRKVLQLPSSRDLTAEESDLIWRFRWSLTGEPRALVAVLKCVDWADAREAKQAMELMGSWSKISVADALELLSPAFSSTEVRSFATDVLVRTDDEELLNYLLQLVQALRYEPSTSSRLVDFLLSRCAANPTLAAFFHWYLFVEWEDPNFGQRAKEVHSKLWEALRRVPGGEETMHLISSQLSLLARLRHLAQETKAARTAGQKTDKLRELLSEKGTCSDLLDLCSPLPLDPSINLMGMVARQCSVFRSAKSPMLLTFRVQRPGGTGTGQYKVIYKRGDDLRQDQLVVKMFTLMDRLFKSENLDLHLTLYKVLPMTFSDGLIECVSATALSDVVLQHKSVLRYLAHHQPDSTAPLGVRKEAMDNYCKSCAGYCVMTYVLGVGDRHQDNIMLCPDGRLFHIDFGYIMGRDPKLFSPAMKLSKEMTEGMGGEGSPEYKKFLNYVIEAYNILRKSAPLLMSLVHLMAGSSIPDIASDPEKAMLKMQEKLRLDLDPEGAASWMQQVIQESSKALMPVLLDHTHRWAQALR